MAENPEVSGRVDENGIVVLTVNYLPGLMFQNDAYSLLSKRLVQEYETRSKDHAQTGSCVVVVKATTAGSPMVSALFELWEKVISQGGQVICVGYPIAYIDSLILTGLVEQPGFSQARSEQDAIAALASAAARNRQP